MINGRLCKRMFATDIKSVSKSIYIQVMKDYILVNFEPCCNLEIGIDRAWLGFSRVFLEILTSLTDAAQHQVPN